jgi:hypothetical protein
MPKRLETYGPVAKKIAEFLNNPKFKYLKMPIKLPLGIALELSAHFVWY